MAATLALIEGGIVFAALLGILLSGVSQPGGWNPVTLQSGSASILTFLCLAAFYYNDLYNTRTVRNLGAYLARLPQSLILSIVFFSAGYAFFFWNVVSPLVFFLASAGIFAALLILRTAFYALLNHPHLCRRVLILGANPLAGKLIEEILSQPHLRYAIIGIVSEGAYRSRTAFGCPVLGTVDRVAEIVESAKPDRIIVAITDRRRVPVRGLLQSRLWGIAIEDGVEVYERLTGKIAMEWLTPSGLIFSQGFRKSPWHIGCARLLGILVSVAALIVFAPLISLIALAIKIDSPGPVFFVQRRVGMGGRPFDLIKFRTMRPAEKPISEWAGDNGDRITRIGKWLRKFRLDELPQFVNVLRGDMNLVGPRPHPVTNFNMFVLVFRNAPECGEEIPYYSLRSWIRPGITGWAQVRYGYANGLEEEIEKARYDLYYVKHMSFWLDLKIILDTFKVVLLGHEQPAADPCRIEASAGAR
jgi:exopolysaccharide biosynthesis polyprenyl glycosylphosphotransferase